MSKILELADVSYFYLGGKRPALSGINLSVSQGEFLAVMGENGAGKTTFCRLINGIIPHSVDGKLLGTVTVDGEITAGLSVPYLARKVGMVLDDPDAQLFTSTVRQEAAFGPENLLLPVQEIEERVAFALSAVGLSGFEERSPSTLSGGEKQRLAIAASLAMAGKILVLDEPLACLDPKGAAEVMSVIKELRVKYQLTVIMATGDSKIAAEYADKICILKEGRIVACGEAKTIAADRDLIERSGIWPRIVSSEQLAVSSEQLAMSGEQLAIEVRDFGYSYEGGVCIENVSFCVEDGDFIAVMGRNGCGKTTLLKNITGLLRPSSGEIFIRGRSVKGLSVSEISKEVGFVMQNSDSQLFTDSVYNEVAFALKNAGVKKQEIQKRVKDALCTVGLSDPDAFPHAQNRADRTKTVIACILAMGCKIIIFDEVDVGQDYRGCIQIMDIVKQLVENGFTVLFVTHNETLACEYANKLIMMERDGVRTVSSEQLAVSSERGE